MDHLTRTPWRRFFDCLTGNAEFVATEAVRLGARYYAKLEQRQQKSARAAAAEGGTAFGGRSAATTLSRGPMVSSAKHRKGRALTQASKRQYIYVLYVECLTPIIVERRVFETFCSAYKPLRAVDTYVTVLHFLEAASSQRHLRPE